MFFVRVWFDASSLLVLMWIAAVILGAALVWAIRSQPRPKPALSSVRGGPGRSAANYWAVEILSGSVPEGLEEFTSRPKDCKNCAGRKKSASLWTGSSASAYLEKGRLSRALHKHELCLRCIKALAKVQAKSQSRVKADVATPAVEKDQKGGKTGGAVRKAFVTVLFLAALMFFSNSSCMVVLFISQIGSFGFFAIVILVVGGILESLFFGGIALLLFRLRASM